MNDSPLTDAIAVQYEKFPYPAPIADLSGTRPDTYEPPVAFRRYWPTRTAAPRELDILVAGCGANQAASIAFSNPTARVTGIDVSRASLAHEQHLKARHGLDNLDLLHLPIEQAATLDRDFDFIVSTGVLHHMQNPQTGINELAKLLRPDAVMLLMLYARYGHLGVSTMQSFFRTLGVGQDEHGLDVVRDALSQLRPDHPARMFMSLDTELKKDTGLIDIFLQARLVTYTVPDCIEFVEAAGLAFQGWFDNAPYHPEYWLGDGPALRALTALPERQMWHAMEMFFTANACHSFIACRRDRPRDDYVIDFDSARAPEFLPSLNDGVAFRDDRLYRLDRHWTLTPVEMRLAQKADGSASIRSIVTDSGIAGDAAAIEKYAVTFFRLLWRLGVATIGLPAKP
jgi:SAM-dependent methyltransferase